MVNAIYRNAFEEVYIILNYLKREEYSKIPKNVIETIEKNRNKDYIFKFDIDKELMNQNMLEETRAILFNLFKDYLCTPKQKEKFLQVNKEQIIKNEQAKREKYNIDVFAENKKKKISNEYDQNEDNSEDENNKLIKTSENIFNKILHKIKIIFNIK